MDSAGFDLGFDGVVMATSTVAVIPGRRGRFETLLASFFPALRASRIAPLAALRESAVDSTSASKGRLIGGTVITALGVATVVTTTHGQPGARPGRYRCLADPDRCGGPRPGRRRPAASMLGCVPSAPAAARRVVLRVVGTGNSTISSPDSQQLASAQ